MNVGFIGVGVMGGHMARHIMEAGYSLYVNDIRKQVAQPLLDKGAVWVDSPKAVTRQCQVILSSLPGPPEVEAVVFGENGLLAGWKKGDIYVDTSTNSPTTMRQVAEKARSIGVEVLDAPVTGGVPAAEAGALNFLVGGKAETLEKVRPILQATAKNIFHVGDNGCGDIAKIVNNMAAFAAFAVDAEAFTLGVKLGIDPATLLKVVMESTGYNSSLNLYGMTIERDDFEPGFRLTLAGKDIRLALDLGKEYGIPLPVGNATAQQIFQAEVAGLGEKGHQTMLLQIEEAAGVKVRIKKK
jgi:3-hydroxyisobutyrate dehydrogenase-like beta-hydroxyacid dehydrogenase